MMQRIHEVRTVVVHGLRIKGRSRRANQTLDTSLCQHVGPATNDDMQARLP